MIATRPREELGREELQGDKEKDMLRARFRAFAKTSGDLGHVAQKLNRSSKAISAYLSGEEPGDVAGLERDIARLLSRKEDLRFAPSRDYSETSVAIIIQECASFALKKGVMVLVTAASGMGKSTILKNLAESDEEILYLLLDIATKSPGLILKRLASLTGGYSAGLSGSRLLELLRERLRRRCRLLLVDDAHFSSWGGFEALRFLHDCTGIGVLLVGQPRTYDEMMGRSDKAMLFDQLLSRLAMKRHIKTISRDDVRLITESKVGPVDRNCLDFLFECAQRQGRFRNLVNVLRLAAEAADELSSPITLQILKESEQFLVF